jgi:hypothetical protein
MQIRMCEPSPVHTSDSEDTEINKRAYGLAMWVLHRWRFHVRYKKMLKLRYTKMLKWISDLGLLRGFPNTVVHQVARDL